MSNILKKGTRVSFANGGGGRTNAKVVSYIGDGEYVVKETRRTVFDPYHNVDSLDPINEFRVGK